MLRKGEPTPFAGGGTVSGANVWNTDMIDALVQPGGAVDVTLASNVDIDTEKLTTRAEGDDDADGAIDGVNRVAMKTLNK